MSMGSKSPPGMHRRISARGAEIPHRDALNLLRLAIGDERAQFRTGQWEAINTLVNRNSRLLVVERTGWGKSMVYFIATRLLRSKGHGTTLIVSPLLALMRNQLTAARRLGIRAETINSTNYHEWSRLEAEVRQGRIDVLLISPERLANPTFVENVLSRITGSIGLLVVDEAHCISDWGHDFRPDYRRLSNVVRSMPSSVPIVGTTATANNRVINDVQAQFGTVRIQRGSLTRKSLALQTLELKTQTERLAWLKDHIGDLPGTGIIYTLTKRDARQVASWLRSHDIHAEPYYAGIKLPQFVDEQNASNLSREYLEDQLRSNRIKSLVATVALGMGYDKPDLRFVIHYQAPASVVGYYQQVGRAGRAVDYAVGLLMTGIEDDDIHEFFRRSAFPPEDMVTSILHALEQSDGLSIRQLEEQLNLSYGAISKVLKYLSVATPSPIRRQGYSWHRTPIRYHLDTDAILRLTQQREKEWAEVQAYIRHPGCLMEYLSRKLDDPVPNPCGKCAQCLGEPIVPEEISHESLLQAGRFLRASEFELICAKQVAKDAFPTYGLRGNIDSRLQAETGRVLSRWNDAGWGHMVAEDKHSGLFRDKLVEAAAEMIRHRWVPHPFPQWVTCIPSNNRPELVPQYAQKLAKTLGLKFIPAVVKVRDNQPQKFQQNRFHQCRNLDGVFDVRRKLPRGPALLVDDVVDSKWTLTIGAFVLRRAGSGPVYPVALTSSGAAD